VSADASVCASHAKLEASITVTEWAARPQPAVIHASFINLFPEPHLKWNRRPTCH
jgi:hypothetical protein